MKIDKMAQQDAEMWAAAEMAYGEGAGTRRKLAQAELDGKYKIPGWYEAFNAAYENLDMNKFAKNAIKERKNLDRMAKAGKNLRAIKSGNLNNLSTGIFIVAGGYIIARKTGYDKVIEAKTKDLYIKAKHEVAVRREKRKLHQVFNISNFSATEDDDRFVDGSDSA